MKSARTTKDATVYIVKWRTPNGRHRTKGGFSTKKAAEVYATKAEAALLAGQAFDPNAGKVLFRDAAQHWLESRKADLKPTTWGGYQYALAPAADRQGDMKTLGIDAVFGGYPLNKITRPQIQDWVNRLITAGKEPSTVRHAYFTVRQILAQAVADNKVAANPADYVKVPGEHHDRVDDPAQFLTAAQVSSLVAATPWPYASLVHVAAWAGLRAAELCGLRVGDVDLPAPGSTKPGTLRVEQTVRAVGGELTALAPKTKGSKRKVPLTPATTELLRDHLAAHPHGPNSDSHDTQAPLWPGVRLTAARPTGVKAEGDQPAQRQAAALGGLTAQEHAGRLVLDWATPYRHATVYKAVFRPAVLRANRGATATGATAAALPPDLRFHALRHTYASLCEVRGIASDASLGVVCDRDSVRDFGFGVVAGPVWRYGRHAI